MKSIILNFSIILLLNQSGNVFTQDLSNNYKMKINMIVNASCAKCQFGKDEDKNCLLAVEVNSEIFYVDGTSIDDYGDAHGPQGFCNVIRKAHVLGELYENRFILEKFRLLNYRQKKKLYSN